MKVVEQVNLKGNLINDYDSKLKGGNNIVNLLSKSFPTDKIKIEKIKKYIVIEYKGNKLKLLIKKLTYSGHPHPIHKKRFQIKLNTEEIKQVNDRKLTLLGIYDYDDNIIFIFPKLYNFNNRKHNNSSVAYVHTIDLINCTKQVKFKKIDINKNTIYLFSQLSDLLDFIITDIYIERDEVNDPLVILDDFILQNLNNQQTWYGKTCIEEMFNDNFISKGFAEWPGSYLEFIFQKHLLNNKINESTVRCLNKKNNKGIFDLWLLDSFYGDLKTHSLNSNAILGNDKFAVTEGVKKYGKIWYLVLKHIPIQDKDHEYEVTKFWNTKLNKINDLLSYGDKMKNRLLLSGFEVLEINSKNLKYVDDFHQGKNSDGNLRNIKIKINKKNLDNFIIYRRFFDSN